MTNEQHREKREVKRILHEEELKRLEEDSKKLDQNEARLSANNRVEANHVVIAKASDGRSKLSPEEYESLTRELVRNLGDVGQIIGQIRDVDISQSSEGGHRHRCRPSCSRSKSRSKRVAEAAAVAGVAGLAAHEAAKRRERKKAEKERQRKWTY
jgi:hypothetical protein